MLHSSYTTESHFLKTGVGIKISQRTSQNQANTEGKSKQHLQREDRHSSSNSDGLLERQIMLLAWEEMMAFAKNMETAEGFCCICAHSKRLCFAAGSKR